MKHMR